MKLKKLLRKYTPKQQSLQHSKTMRWARHWLFNPNLWHLNRRSVAAGIAIGLFSACLPIPLHMLFAVFLCVLFHGHVALAITATWIANPFTYAPLYYFNYKIGAFLLGQHPRSHLPLDHYEAIIKQLHYIWQPLLLGSLLSGLLLALISYIAIRLYWRSQVLDGWRRRREMRLRRIENPHE